MREDAVNHIDKHAGQNDDQCTAGVHDVALQRITSIPSVVDYVVNNIIHNLFPPKNRTNETGDSSNKGQSKERVEPIFQKLQREKGIQEGDNVRNHFLSPNLRQIRNRKAITTR